MEYGGGGGRVALYPTGNLVITGTIGEKIVNMTLSAVWEETVRVTLSTATSSTTASTLQLTATVTNATNTKVTWSSSNTSVATVSTSGKVTRKGAGTVTITATSQADSRVKASATITITKTGSKKCNNQSWTDKGSAPQYGSGVHIFICTKCGAEEHWENTNGKKCDRTITTYAMECNIN